MIVLNMIKKRKNIDPKRFTSKTGSTQVFEYGKINQDLDIAIAIIKGEYPGEKKWDKNIEVETMSYYVILGEGKFEDGEKFNIKPSDCVFIKKDRGYRIEANKGEKIEALMASNPGWSADQYLIY